MQVGRERLSDTGISYTWPDVSESSGHNENHVILKRVGKSLHRNRTTRKARHGDVHPGRRRDWDMRYMGECVQGAFVLDYVMHSTPEL